jgi:hypothetical protein
MSDPQSTSVRETAGPGPALFAAVVGTGAFLLFEVQFVLGKRLLPWFGGASAVWTTCLLFFQAGLLGGYAWAHVLADRLSARRQRDLHVALVVAALGLLAWRGLTWPSPITPGDALRPWPTDPPVLVLLLLLASSVGLPYLVLAATSPLLQSWLAHLRPGASPFWLFALSNAGSLLGLVAYPLVVEPRADLREQGWLWAAAFAVYAVGVAWCAVAVGRRAKETEPVPMATGGQPPDDREDGPGRRGLWLVLATFPSLMLVAVTSHLTQEVAAVPFLWMLPLGVYLVTFILCFGWPRATARSVWGPMLAVAAALALAGLYEALTLGVREKIVLWSVVLFVYGMAGHGELARLRPHPRQLTAYYLTIAAGGATGGALVALVAPFLFDGYWELHLGILAGPFVVAAAWLADPKSPLGSGGDAVRALRLRVGAAAFLVVLAGLLVGDVVASHRDVELATRGFYGVLRVRRVSRGEPDEQLELLHGRIAHGTQLTAPARRLEPTTYFGPSSGGGLAIRRHPRRLAGRPMRVGVVGLGVGTLAAWSEPGDVFRFYELDPDVVRLSTGEHPVFTFLRAAKGEMSVALGDGRLTLEREEPQGFQVLVIDAFSSDAIPTHLLTREAFSTYERHLAPDGILAVQVTNRWVDLKPVVRGTAAACGLRALHVPSYERDTLWSSDWMLVARDPALLRDELIDAASLPPLAPARSIVWTDAWSDLFGVLKR